MKDSYVSAFLPNCFIEALKHGQKITVTQLHDIEEFILTILYLKNFDISIQLTYHDIKTDAQELLQQRDKAIEKYTVSELFVLQTV